MAYHKAILVGNVGKDPELKYTQQGTAVCNFSLAVTEKYNDKETTTWYKIVLWKNLAEIANQYVSKGSKVFIDGSPSLEVYLNNKGEAAGNLVVTANRIEFMSGARSGESYSSADREEEIPW